MEFLIPRKYLSRSTRAGTSWDLEVYRGIWSKARVAVATENHGGTKRLLNVRSRGAADAGVAARASAVFAIAGALRAHLRDARGHRRRASALGLVNLGVIVVGECPARRAS